MSTRSTRDWSGGALPLITSDVLADIISAAAEISIIVTDVGRILSVLVNPEHQSFGTRQHWDGRDIRDLLKPDSVPKIEARLQPSPPATAAPGRSS